MKDILIAALPYILGGGVVGLLVFLITAKEVKRKAILENNGTSIGNDKEFIESLKQVIQEVRADSEFRKDEAAHYRKKYEEELAKNANLCEENTTVKMLMCTHMGCKLRKPMMGQGDQWYSAHKEDPSLGCDYLPINQLLRNCGLEKQTTE